MKLGIFVITLLITSCSSYEHQSNNREGYFSDGSILYYCNSDQKDKPVCYQVKKNIIKQHLF